MLLVPSAKSSPPPSLTHTGLIPSWYRGNPRNLKLSTINARIEGLTEKATFRNPLKKGRRCVVLADGYYEWKTTPDGKQPYFVYVKPNKPMAFAAVYDVWYPGEGWGSGGSESLMIFAPRPQAKGKEREGCFDFC